MTRLQVLLIRVTVLAQDSSFLTRLSTTKHFGLKKLEHTLDTTKNFSQSSESSNQETVSTACCLVGVATWFRNGTATYPPAARAISSQTPTWWTANGVY